MPDDYEAYQLMDLEHGAYSGGVTSSSGGRRRRRRRRKKRARLKKFLGGALVLLLVVFGVWYVMDNMMMYWFVLFNDNDSVERRQSDELGTWSSNYGTSSGNSWGASNLGYGNPGASVIGGIPHVTATTPKETIDQYATREFGLRCLIFAMDQAGYVPNCTIGSLACIMAEGGTYGTFTYEAYAHWAGPSGVVKDNTLNNQAWLDWIDTTGRDEAHNGYYHNSKKHDDTSKWGNGKEYTYSALGLGLVQESNTFRCTIDSSGGCHPIEGHATGNATKICELAEAAGCPWQCPAWQIGYLVDTRMAAKNAYDQDTVPADPKSDLGISSIEWASRMLCGIEMPGYRFTTVQDDPGSKKSYDSHTAQIDKATELYNKYSYKDELFYNADGSLLNQELEYKYTSESQKAGLAIAKACLILATGDQNKYGSGNGDSKLRWSSDGWNVEPLISTPEVQNYRRALYNMGQRTYYASCDRGAACAIRMSGVDTEFPVNKATGGQGDYLLGHPEKWLDLGIINKELFKQLMPGDVVMTPEGGHIKIYVSNEVVRTLNPQSTSNFYQASYHGYYPYLSYESHIDPDYDNTRLGIISHYHVFRNINPMWDMSQSNYWQQVPEAWYTS